METNKPKAGRNIWGVVAFVVLVIVLALIRIFHLY